MTELRVDRRWRAAVLGAAVFLGVMALVAAIFLIGRSERAFELHRWENRLRAASAQRLVIVNQWLNESRSAMRSASVNPTVQIYLSELATANAASQSVPYADTQLAFMANYVASLGRSGPFAATAGGVAIFDSRYRLVAATIGYRPSPHAVKDFVAASKRAQGGLRASGATIGFLNVIAPIQGNTGAVGYVIGKRKLDTDFWSSGGAILGADHGHESLLAVGPGKAVQLVSSSIEAKRTGELAASSEGLAALNAGHLQQASDLAARESLSFGVPVEGTKWVLVESVPRNVALGGVDARIQNLTIILLLSLLAIILAVLGLWRHNAAAQQIAMREANAKLYRGIANALLAAIDERDPGAADHSRRVARLARDMAVKMGLSATEADTVELAGALMNVGKLFVPPELLTKQGALDDVEAARFEEGSRRWLDLLRQTPLNPPVEPILREAYSLGTNGPAKLENLSRDAYIVVAANVAVALTSRRAYRSAYAPAETVEILSRSGISFPKPVMTVLSDLLLARA